MKADIDLHIVPDEKNKKLVILNAGRPYNSLPEKNPAGNSSLATSIHGKSTLEWVLMATGLTQSEVSIVGGYRISEMKAKFQDVDIIENRDWRNTGSAGSLLSVDLSELDEILVCYGDILFRRKIVQNLRNSDADVSIAWDSKFRNRYIGRSEGDINSCEKVAVRNGGVDRLGEDIQPDWAAGEFIGLVRLKGRALSYLKSLQNGTISKQLEKLSLPKLLEWIRLQGVEVSGYDVMGDWAELNEKHDIARFVLGTKAESLSRLSQVVTISKVQPQVAFSLQEWRDNTDEVVSLIRNRFHGDSIIVRSSAKSEDSFSNSNAGAYTSLLNIDPQGDVHSAIEEVGKSYVNAQPDDQILVQPMVSNVVMSGVIFTQTLDYGAPYYVVNFSEGEETDVITGGSEIDSVTYFVRRDFRCDSLGDANVGRLIEAVKEIELLLSYGALDIEFAIDNNGDIYILQVRPIAVAGVGSGIEKSCRRMIDEATSKWHTGCDPRSRVFGDIPLYGVMPDWNPAEIIGTNAGNLAGSLYKNLITDEIWAKQRAEYGYKDIRPHPLLVNFCGKNYVDVRASFNSFVPKDVDNKLQKKVVNFCLKRLRDNPHFHDKIEFEVVPTCFSFGWDNWQALFTEDGSLSAVELDQLEASLKRITVSAIRRVDEDMRVSLSLDDRFDEVFGSLPKNRVESVRRLLEECRQYGTLPFAHLARAGFVAVTLLRDAVDKGILSQDACDAFLGSIRTVSHEVLLDADRVAAGDLRWDSFVARYGHLRPGTYDIMSPAYFENPEHYLRPMISTRAHASGQIDSGKAWEDEKATFFSALSDLGIVFPDIAVENFLRKAVEGREKSKFIFTKYLSAALDELVKWGADVGLSREELSHLDIHNILEVCDDAAPLAWQVKTLKKRAKKSKKVSKVAAACQLPELITSIDDFSYFKLRSGQPNFIGSNDVTAQIRVLQNTAESMERKSDYKGCIVMIPQADPGYDWLFGQGISGLITMYGGANSHMAIRSAEFGMPAAIGVGERIYNSLVDAQVIELSPRNKILRPIR